MTARKRKSKRRAKRAGSKALRAAAPANTYARKDGKVSITQGMDRID